MARDLRTFSFTGRAGADAERRHTVGGQLVVSFRCAVQDRPGSDGQEQVLWLTVQAWGRLGEAVAERVKKGTRVAGAGELSQRSWVGDDGQRRQSLELRADSLILLGPRGPVEVVEAPATPEGTAVMGVDLPF